MLKQKSYTEIKYFFSRNLPIIMLQFKILTEKLYLVFFIK